MQHKLDLNKVLAWLAGILVIPVIVLGSYTRLVDAGLGCPDWPGCYGHWSWPTTTADINVAQQLWPHDPVHTEKAIPEMVHRYSAGLFGILILFNFIYAWAKRTALLRTSTLLGLVIVQALLGMWTVTLKLWPIVVVLHLLLGFGIMALLARHLLITHKVSLTLAETNPTSIKPVRRWVYITSVVLWGQIILGGWTSANYAALACPDLPTCQGEWFPAGDWGAGFNFAQQIGPNYLGGLLDHPSRVAIHYTHRWGALLLLSAIGVLVWLLWQLKQKTARYCALQLMALVSIQIAIGIGNIVFQLPLLLAVMHNICAALLVISWVVIHYTTSRTIPRKQC